MLEKYIFYFERYNNNKKAKEIAKKDKSKMDDLILKLHNECNYDVQILDFLRESAAFLGKFFEIIILCYTILYLLLINQIKIVSVNHKTGRKKDAQRLRFIQLC